MYTVSAKHTSGMPTRHGTGGDGGVEVEGGLVGGGGAQLGLVLQLSATDRVLSQVDAWSLILAGVLACSRIKVVVLQLSVYITLVFNCLKPDHKRVALFFSTSLLSC